MSQGKMSKGKMSKGKMSKGKMSLYHLHHREECYQQSYYFIAKQNSDGDPVIDRGTRPRPNFKPLANIRPG